ncbi:MAG: bifunctional [glutamine synthetase] adenylyltransferase/[glutamine synthetase]-adenylyl-L-tyrosine phosphorylase [Alphaproteobacteria bacterium]|nr:bifunctional [glutamine synthetase] adenylyltransferase/[glutamine synthetase]-adenylyl-L-tyrosine phosphorylase [Alphaproteobacteria bacterium]
MSDKRFLSSIRELPRPGDPQAADLGVASWREHAAQAEDPALAQFGRELADDATGHRLLRSLFGNSPFLGHTLIQEMAFCRHLVVRGLDSTFADLCRGINGQLTGGDGVGTDRSQLMTGLRRARRQAALLVGLADISGLWPVERVIRSLSDFADAAINAAACHLIQAAAANGSIVLPPCADATGSGIAVFGMGKLGGRELNYSSDIDLIVFYDSAILRGSDPDELQSRIVRVIRDLVRMLEERTRDGYVFRTDLRLRPDAGVTPVAMSMDAAELYYESMGQNWERAAMIKARTVAGDLGAGQAFLARLRPFLWRRHLDFAAIQDIHSIKRQIQAHRGGADVAVFGHNVKLGRGGIREIEFFAQTQQLIWGGRDPRLRVAATCDALAALAAAGRIKPTVADELTRAYRFLRKVEHRLQMVDDRQTHALPADEAGLARLAAFMGYADTESFQSELLAQLNTVSDRYAALFEEAAPLSGPGNLVFTGTENDPETVRTLESLGFRDGNAVAATVRAWHHGRYRAMRSERARQLLTEIKPALIAALARTADPAAAFHRFDAFLGRLPAGVQLFSLFHSHPELLDLVAEIMGDAPVLAEQLARHPILLDGVLAGDAMAALPDVSVLSDDLTRALTQAGDFQDVLDLARRWANDRKFQVGLQLLRGALDGEAAGARLADIADAVILGMQPRVEAEFARQHGDFRPGGMAVIAMGKLGGRELTVASDLDLIFVYAVGHDGEGDASGNEAVDEAVTIQSNGAKPLAPMTYFTRLSQRLTGSLEAQTGEGSLYQIDLRLRPSGNKGPLACTVESFEAYQEKDAWTWEHMALTRARVVTGSPPLRRRVEAIVRRLLTQKRDVEKLVVDVAEMRARIAREHRVKGPWFLKHTRGGLVDVEFLAQYLQLRHAAQIPEVLSANTVEALRRLAAHGAIPAAAGEELSAAARLLTRVQGLIRLTVGEGLDETVLPAGLRARLARAGGVDDLDQLKDRLGRAMAHVRRHFDDLIETPAARYRSVSNPEEAK